MKRVAIIGTTGVPAGYGGFETLVENIIGDNASRDIEYTVFCSSKDCTRRLERYKGAELRYLDLHANGMQSVIYDGLSLMKSIRGYDVVVVLGVSGGLFFPIFRLLSRCRFIVNIDGLEWKRKKWGTIAKAVLYISEKMSLIFADAVIADNQAIANCIARLYGKKIHVIAYGGDHAHRTVSKELNDTTLTHYNLRSKEYAMTVCRIEPENNCHMILEAFAKCGEPLIFIGNWNKGAYGQSLRKQYSQLPNIHIIDALYDLDTLHTLRSNCKYYIHGHSAGGTNPSLVEAMSCNCNIIAFDVAYNRATTEEQAHYFGDTEQLLGLLEECKTDLKSNASIMHEIANRRYTWATIVQQYEALY